MRIAIATWSSRRVGGVEDYLALLIAALGESNHELMLWYETDGPRDRESVDPNRSVVHVNAGELGVDGAIRALRAWAPDVLYVQGLHDVDAEAALLDVAPAVFFLHTYMGTCISGSKTFSRPSVQPCSRRFGAPCLVQFFPRGCGGNSPITMWQLYRRESDRLRLFRRYARVLTHTGHMRDEMARHGIAADVVPFPVAPVCAAAIERDERISHLLFAGRMHYLKGASLLLEALPQVARESPRPVRVTFAGDGPEKQSMESAARKLEGASGGKLSVEFPGWVSQAEVGRLLRTVHLLVVPSVWPEPFGSVGPAAGLAGVPAAAFASGGIKEWLIDGVCGHLAPSDPPTSAGLAAAIARCLRDPAHYRVLSCGARRWAARFTMENHIPALMAAFEHTSA